MAARFGLLLASALLAAALPAGGQPQKATTPASAVRAPVAGEPDCAALWRQYRRSQACFARYRTVNGIRPEAFRACGPERLDPSPQCGPPPAR